VIVLGSGSGSYRVTAVFRQAFGIVPSGQVWSGGGLVGSISSIRLGADGLPRVTMQISDGYRLRATATADLRLQSNSGELNRIIMLAQGQGPELPNGAVIPVSRTSEPVEIDDILGMLSPRVRADLRYVTAQLDGSSTGLSSALDQTLQHSAAALSQTAAALGQVDSDGYALRMLISQGRTAVGVFASQRATLGAAVDATNHLLRTTAARQLELQAAVHALPAGLRAPRLALDQLRAEIPSLSSLITAAMPAVAQLRPTTMLLARTLTTGLPGLAAIASTLRSAPAQLRSLKPLLEVASPVIRRLTPTLRQLLPILDVLRVYTPELMGFIAGWSDIGVSFDAAGHAVRVGFAKPPPNTPASADGNAPGYVPAPFERTPGALVGQPWTDYANSFLSRTGAGR
jgi:phospholipid/cholesterol/gamma-HCH transport system substrate-binding protein